jgi:hypothetical protein
VSSYPPTRHHPQKRQQPQQVQWTKTSL